MLTQRHRYAYQTSRSCGALVPVVNTSTFVQTNRTLLTRPTGILDTARQVLTDGSTATLNPGAGRTAAHAKRIPSRMSQRHLAWLDLHRARSPDPAVALLSREGTIDHRIRIHPVVVKDLDHVRSVGER